MRVREGPEKYKRWLRRGGISQYVLKALILMTHTRRKQRGRDKSLSLELKLRAALDLQEDEFAAPQGVVVC